MKKKGVGIGSTFYGTGYGNGFPDVSRAKAALKEDGKVAVHVGATEVGQGSKTIMSQMAAEVMSIPLNDIIFICEDTKNMPDSGTAAASRQTYNTGNAIKLACEDLRKKVIENAFKKLKLNSSVGLTLKNGEIYLKTLPSKNISLKELALCLLKNKELPLTGEGSFTAQTIEMDEETGQGAPYWPYTFNVYGVIVEVDTETGLIDIIKAVCAQDVGKAINPEMIEGQMDGGFAMGLGYSIYEDLGLKEGKMKNKKFTNYLIPTVLDVPELEKFIIEDPESTGPFGAKGIGEPVMLGVAPAVLNAIYDAVGVRITQVPVTPDRLLRALKEERRE